MAGAPATFEPLVESVFQTELRWSPSFATSLGIHDYDASLSDPRRAHVEHEIAERKRWLADFDGISAQSDSLFPVQRIDLEAMRYTLRLGLFQGLELRSWERSPDFVMEVLDHVFTLLVRDTHPLEKRVKAIAARLEGTPEYLFAGRNRLRRMPRLWVEMAQESAKAAPGTLAAARELAASAPASLRTELDLASKIAGEAFAEHREWLENELDARANTVENGWAIGEERMRKLVELRLLGLTMEEILAKGAAWVEEKEKAVRKAASEVIAVAGGRPGSDPVREATALLGKDHPATFPEVLAAYRASAREAREFVGGRGIASLPRDDRLDVVETPGYLRHVIPFAAYFPPPRFEPVKLGVYMVTPRPVEEFPQAEIQNTTVHEGYPGHHLQLTMANTHPSTARLLVGATETIEGWAHYCEEMMFRYGYATGPAVRFVQLKDQLWRACRIVIDISIHCGSMSFEEGVALLTKKTGMPQAGAVAELKRYTQTPGYQLSYLLGKTLIQEMGDRAAARGLSERGFHDRLLRAGSLPAGLLSRELEGV